MSVWLSPETLGLEFTLHFGLHRHLPAGKWEALRKETLLGAETGTPIASQTLTSTVAATAAPTAQLGGGKTALRSRWFQG